MGKKKYNNPCCSCGLDKDLSRDFVFIKNNTVDLMKYENGTCPECGHQINGITLSSLKEFKNNLWNNAKEEGRKQGAVDFAKRINTEMEERLFRTDSARLEFIYKLIKKELK